jgi:hypothetical protein
VSAAVSWLTIAPVKGLALVRVDEIQLEPAGVAENRRFYLIDEAGLRFGLLRCGELVQVVPEYDPRCDALTLRFPDGSAVGGEVELGERVTTDFYGRPVTGRVVEGPWAEALSAHVRSPIRLVQSDQLGAGVDRGRGGVSMVSDASVEELGRQAGEERVDPRRFRMLVGLAGCRPHEEDEWLGSRVRVGGAVVRLLGHVGRCAITTQNPDTGRPDLDTLRVIKGYRGLREREVDFGVFGEVVESGPARVGDPVEPES